MEPRPESAFVPSPDELIVVVKHWATVEIGIRFSFFITRSIFSSDARTGSFGLRRIANIAEIIGPEESTKAVSEAREEYREHKGIDPHTWNVFLRGIEEERAAFPEQVDSTPSAADPAANSQATHHVQQDGSKGVRRADQLKAQAPAVTKALDTLLSWYDVADPVNGNGADPLVSTARALLRNAALQLGVISQEDKFLQWSRPPLDYLVTIRDRSIADDGAEVAPSGRRLVRRKRYE